MVAEHVASCASQRQQSLTGDLVVYIELLRCPLNSNDVVETSLSLTYIRIHLCQRHRFPVAKQRFSYFLHLAKHLIEKGIVKESVYLPKRIQSTAEFESYKAKVIPDKILEKIATKPTTQELFDNALSSCCPSKIAKCLNEYTNSFKTKARRLHKIPLIVFLKQASASHSKWYELPSIIQDELQKYNEDLNTRSIKSRPTSRSQYINVKNALSMLIEHNMLPKDTHLPDFRRKPTKEHAARPIRRPLTASAIDEKLKHMSTRLDADVYGLITVHVRSRAIKAREQQELIKDLVTYTEILCESFNSNDADVTSNNLAYIYIHVCQTYVFLSAKKRVKELSLLVEHLIQKGIVDEFISLPKRMHSAAEYESCKAKTIPAKVLEKIATKPSGQKLFNNTLRSCCSLKIAKRLAEHVNSFKARERKSHRKPLVEFLNQISAIHSKWYEHPRIIQGELLKYRGSLLNRLTRNSAYRDFQNVKNAISVLIEHNLLPQDTHLPDNLRKLTNVEKVRKENPLIAQVDLYDETRRQSYVDTPTFIQDLKAELSKNLKLLVKEAQNIVYKGYHKFLTKDALVARSQRNEYLSHPELLVSKIKNKKVLSYAKKINPFAPLHPLEEENRIAYYDYHFDSLIKHIKPNKISELKFGQGILEYFGLTPLISSAMQIIITEELGINPHSLYNAKVSSDGHEQEFVQVDDEGGVRIKTLKARAKRVSTRTAKGSLAALANIDAQNINAAACLKMALEMGARARESLGAKSLWTCLLVTEKAGVPWTSTFQTYFAIIRDRAYSESGSEALKVATLKKVRCSKGVFIYLESNGDILKAATYFGNQVKTALNRYIPTYLAELIYRVKIRSFQNILLFMAVASDDSPSGSLGISEKDFKRKVTQAFSNPDMGGRMFEKLTKPISSEKKEIVKYFCVSDKNIQLALKYAKYGTDETLKADCVTVLSKISEGPVIMKQMLRKAYIVVQNSI
ncbi:hypothetical protein SAMN04488540_12330 [Ferrimonas sediminum]|uniref:Uncharacterized protein n=1 Tax=Ferrimonas sediminum TaxID=718193 RepID=A0A1G9AG97_9GAMM|nr:hypothetical protein SAMN04488540_12330 [Ferrimonas sediminum]